MQAHRRNLQSARIQLPMWSLVIITALCALPTSQGVALDLTHDFDEGSPYWVGVQPFEFTKKTEVNTTDGGWYAMNEFCAGEHGGTHFDAPYHFWRDGWRVGEVPLDRLIVPGVVIDASGDAQSDVDFELQESHIDAFERAHGALSTRGPSVVVLVKFGWSQFYSNRTAYFGTDGNDTSQLHFPGLSSGAARRLVDTGNVVGVGVDCPSVDRGQNDGKYITHQLLAAANIYNLENVAMDSPDLPETGFKLYVMPMKIAKGTGAPCRIVAVIDE